MLLSDSHISMRPLCSDMLLWLVECIFVTCLTKCLSCLVGFQSSICSSICFSIIVSMLLFIIEGFMELWEVAWVLDLKSGTKSGVAVSELAEKYPIFLHALAVRVIGGSQSHACPCHGSDWGSRLVNCQVTSGVDHLGRLVGS